MLILDLMPPPIFETITKNSLAIDAPCQSPQAQDAPTIEIPTMNQIIAAMADGDLPLMNILEQYNLSTNRLGYVERVYPNTTKFFHKT